jgi:tricorn protease
VDAAEPAVQVDPDGIEARIVPLPVPEARYSRLRAAAIRLSGPGPVVGTRTWGGVIGFDDFRELVDGTRITIPQDAFSFDRFGWGLENYGVDPDVEVDITPTDWACGRDPQLETAVRLAIEALDKQPAASPPDPRTGPRKTRPPLPPRS